MTEPKYIYKLNSVIKQLKDEDLVPALFLMEMDKEFNTFYGFNRLCCTNRRKVELF